MYVSSLEAIIPLAEIYDTLYQVLQFRFWKYVMGNDLDNIIFEVSITRSHHCIIRLCTLALLLACHLSLVTCCLPLRRVQINGAVNERIVSAVAATPSTRFTFVSAHAFILPGLLLNGYYAGKHRVETAIEQQLPGRGVALRPSMVYGVRGGFDSGLFARPWAKLANAIPHGETARKVPGYDMLCVPPVSVQNVANAAVVTAGKGAADPRVPKAGQSPFIDVFAIQDNFGSTA